MELNKTFYDDRMERLTEKRLADSSITSTTPSAALANITRSWNASFS